MKLSVWQKEVFWQTSQQQLISRFKSKQIEEIAEKQNF